MQAKFSTEKVVCLKKHLKNNGSFLPMWETMNFN